MCISEILHDTCEYWVTYDNDEKMEIEIQEFSLTGLNGLGNSKNLHLHDLLLLLLKVQKSGIFWRFVMTIPSSNCRTWFLSLLITWQTEKITWQTEKQLMTKLKTSVWRTAENQKQTENVGFQLVFVSWDRNIGL